MGENLATPNTTRLKALDLFCGLGGWSDGLTLEGFDVTGVEIEPRIAALYKHRVIVSDVCALDPHDFKGYDLIVGSPPCRDFTTSIGNVFGHRWKNPPDPKGEGMKLVNTFLKFVEITRPRYWLMENVTGLKKYLDKPSRCTTYIGPNMKRTFWGNFPSFLIPVDMNKESIYYPGSFCKPRDNSWLRSWNRAKIPLPVARALGAAVRQAIQGV
jgi:hypothetical protein